MTGRAPAGDPIRVSFGSAGITAVDSVDSVDGVDVDGTAVCELVVTPGLVDLQLNGYGGIDINAAGTSADDLLRLTTMLARRGVTTFLPTIISADRATTRRLIEQVVVARKAHPQVAAAVPGIHLEGPYLSAADGARGAHDPTVLRDPDRDEFDEWQQAADGLVRIMTLAPERPGSMPFVQHLRESGVVASMGHSCATADQVHGFAAAGGRLSTHLGNGIPATVARHLNVVWPQLNEAGLTASLIADGEHLPVDVFAAMVAAKGSNRCLLVSDAAALAGCPPGDYETPVGGSVTVGPTGRLTLSGTPYLAGSGAALDECVSWAGSIGGCTLAATVTMATSTPADVAGLVDRGHLAAGRRADLIRWECGPTGRLGRPVDVVVGGEAVVRDGEPV